jgi:hypothetical protein
VMAQRMEEAILSFQDQLLLAARSPRKEDALRLADFHLERLKLYNRMALELRLSAFAQYEHLAAGLEELGRLLGGWLRSLRPAERRAGARRNRRGTRAVRGARRPEREPVRLRSGGPSWARSTSAPPRATTLRTPRAPRPRRVRASSPVSPLRGNPGARAPAHCTIGKATASLARPAARTRTTNTSAGRPSA